MRMASKGPQRGFCSGSFSKNAASFLASCLPPADAWAEPGSEIGLLWQISGNLCQPDGRRWKNDLNLRLGSLAAPTR
jgi:hypothetical protein